MANMEQLELDAHRSQLAADVEALVERYRSIFEWDIPEIDQGRSDRLIFRAGAPRRFASVCRRSSPCRTR